MYQALAEHKLADVLVRSQQKSAAAVCEGENPGVVNPWIKLLNIYDLVTGRPQGGDDRASTFSSATRSNAGALSRVRG